jgi:hypothetical protein
MSKLEYLARPLVAFDPYNKEHRRYYAEYLEYKGWGSCPVRFICTEDHGDNLPAMIQRIMVAYYVEREFGGSKMSQAQSKTLNEAADRKYKEAGQLRKQAQSLLKPRR